MQLTLVTLNTWKGEGDYPARLSAMGDLIADLHPDIVFLQEVFAVPGTEIGTAISLQRRLGFKAICHPARRKVLNFQGGPVVSTSGLAILTRFETRNARRLVLPSDPADGERIAQIAEIDPAPSRGIGLHAVNLHLTHLRDARALRQSQFAAACGAVGLTPGAPLLFAGDFNDDADRVWLEDAVGSSGREIRNGRENPGSACKSPTLIHPPQDGGPSCIDHILYAPRGVKFIEISHHGDATASDHLVVRAVIDLGE